MQGLKDVLFTVAPNVLHELIEVEVTARLAAGDWEPSEVELLRLMVSTDNALNNAVAASFSAPKQTDFPDRRKTWDDQIQFATAMSEWAEVFYNHQIRHPTRDYKTSAARDGSRSTAHSIVALEANPGCLINGRTSNSV
jgi:hypothetical protein